jgi:Uma2 family endonuclease
MALSWNHLLEAADDAGIRLEIVEGTPTWEAWPASRHQIVLQRIERSLKPVDSGSDCGCFGVHDVYIRFPDGSLKRPDLAIFCEEPPLLDEALEIIPGAVVEVVSKGFERKDLETGPPFYLSQGVKDVVVVNPYDGRIHHFTAQGERVLSSPQVLELGVGCEIQV